MRSLQHSTALLLVTFVACGGGENRLAADAAQADTAAATREDGSPTDDGSRGVDFADYADPASFEYAWSCEGTPTGSGVSAVEQPPSPSCDGLTWPALDPALVCPTLSSATRVDPISGNELPPADERALPVTIEPAEVGSFLPSEAPASWPTQLRVVSWNMRFTSDLDAQIDRIADDETLSQADVYLLSEVDRCSRRNGVRRAARMLAERVGGAYAYGVEFVELDIGRTVGGDTGQAIVARRPLTSVGVLCHSQIKDWLADDEEPRLGQRVTLFGDVPVGEASVRVHAVHFESEDAFGDGRAVQVKELLDLSQAEACDRPQIVAGDFNTWYETAPERVLMRGAGFLDAMEELGHLAGTHDNGLRLDYLWARGLAAMSGGAVPHGGTSDHAILWADLVLRP